MSHKSKHEEPSKKKKKRTKKKKKKFKKTYATDWPAKINDKKTGVSGMI